MPGPQEGQARSPSSTAQHLLPLCLSATRRNYVRPACAFREQLALQAPRDCWPAGQSWPRLGSAQATTRVLGHHLRRLAGRGSESVLGTSSQGRLQRWLSGLGHLSLTRLLMGGTAEPAARRPPQQGWGGLLLPTPSHRESHRERSQPPRAPRGPVAGTAFPRCTVHPCLLGHPPESLPSPAVSWDSVPLECRREGLKGPGGSSQLGGRSRTSGQAGRSPACWW